MLNQGSEVKVVASAHKFSEIIVVVVSSVSHSPNVISHAPRVLDERMMMRSMSEMAEKLLKKSFLLSDAHL